jgi:hypothetical protein
VHPSSDGEIGARPVTVSAPVSRRHQAARSLLFTDVESSTAYAAALGTRRGPTCWRPIGGCAHRLLKNRVTEELKIRAYCLITDAVLARMDAPLELAVHQESGTRPPLAWFASRPDQIEPHDPACGPGDHPLVRG